MTEKDGNEEKKDGRPGLNTAGDAIEAAGTGCCLLELFAAASILAAFLATPAALWPR